MPGSDDAAEPPADSASEEEEKPRKGKKEPTIPDVVRNLTLADLAGLTELDDAFLIASFAGVPSLIGIYNWQIIPGSASPCCTTSCPGWLPKRR